MPRGGSAVGLPSISEIQAGRTPTLRHVPVVARSLWCKVLTKAFAAVVHYLPYHSACSMPLPVEGGNMPRLLRHTPWTACGGGKMGNGSCSGKAVGGCLLATVFSLPLDGAILPPALPVKGSRAKPAEPCLLMAWLLKIQALWLLLQLCTLPSLTRVPRRSMSCRQALKWLLMRRSRPFAASPLLRRLAHRDIVCNISATLAGPVAVTAFWHSLLELLACWLRGTPMVLPRLF